MIVTVKLSNLNYQTFAIHLGSGLKGSDAEFLNLVNEQIRLHLWNNVFTLEDKRKYGDYDHFFAPPIVMMYSRNRYSSDQ